MSHDLTGTIVPVVTPFSADESFDARAMAKLIDYVIGEGADALMPTALTGEGLLLSPDETLGVWDVVFESAAGRLPVVPAILSLTTRLAVDLTRAASNRGAAAAMVAPILPELYARRSQDEVIAFYSEVASVTTLPLILFNYPSLTGVDLLPPLVERLSEIPTVRYIKESSGDSRRVHQIQRAVGERIAVVCGAPDTALESIALGCRAWITGILNIAPRSGRQLMTAAERSEMELARRIYYRQILPLVDEMAGNNNPTGTIKAGLGARGVEVGAPRRPGRPLAGEPERRVVELVGEITQAELEMEPRLAEGRHSRP